jgi:hypothetical protein
MNAMNVSRKRTIERAREAGRKDRELFREEFGTYPVDGPTFGDWDAVAWGDTWPDIKPAGDDDELYTTCWAEYRRALFSDSEA